MRARILITYLLFAISVLNAVDILGTLYFRHREGKSNGLQNRK